MSPSNFLKYLQLFQEAEYLDKYGTSKKGEADTAPKAEEPVKEAEVEVTEEDLASPNLYPLPKEEVIRRLREINQAIRLFGRFLSDFNSLQQLVVEKLTLNTGESDEGANRRLRSLVLDEDDNFRLRQQLNITKHMKCIFWAGHLFSRGPNCYLHMIHFRLHKTTNDYQEAMKLVDKQYLKIIEVQHTANYLQSNHFEPLIIN